MTALMLAVENNYKKVVSLLLDYKADTKLQNEEGKTALMIAQNKKFQEIIIELVAENCIEN